MKVIETEIPGVLLIQPTVLSDARGFFLESYNEARFNEAGINNRFVQDNHSKSTRGTLRGMHYQIERPQAKLCRVIEGEVLDVVVDIRSGSPSFGKHVSTVLSADNKMQIMIPRGFAHGFLVLSETAQFLYKCDDFYYPEFERGILWNDPNLGIDWAVNDPTMSTRDRRHPRLSDTPV
ncbi:MAG: dTDP-4-dehydrorhamnose 3,5-epimerase, partial [Blastocatellia bacterium]